MLISVPHTQTLRLGPYVAGGERPVKLPGRSPSQHLCRGGTSSDFEGGYSPVPQLRGASLGCVSRGARAVRCVLGVRSPDHPMTSSAGPATRTPQTCPQTSLFAPQSQGRGPWWQSSSPAPPCSCEAQRVSADGDRAAVCGGSGMAALLTHGAALVVPSLPLPPSLSRGQGPRAMRTAWHPLPRVLPTSPRPWGPALSGVRPALPWPWLTGRGLRWGGRLVEASLGLLCRCARMTLPIPCVTSAQGPREGVCLLVQLASGGRCRGGHSCAALSPRGYFGVANVQEVGSGCAGNAELCTLTNELSGRCAGTRAWF